MPDLIEARWVAGYPVILPDGAVLNPGDTYRLTRGEAEASDNWQPVRAAKADSKGDS